MLWRAAVNGSAGSGVLASGKPGLLRPRAGALKHRGSRLAIDPDTLQERQFLKMLAEALDVPSDAVARLDAEFAG